MARGVIDSMVSTVPRIGRPSGVGAEHRVGELLVDEVAGVVVAHRDLFEDHVALGLDVVRAQQRGRHEVADDVDRQRQVGVEHPRVEAGVLLAGEGVHLAADGVERGGDVQRRAARGALEQQVLEEVRGTGLRRGLVARADADPDAEGGRAHARDVLGDHAQPAGQHGAAHARAVLDEQRAGGAGGLLTRTGHTAVPCARCGGA